MRKVWGGGLLCMLVLSGCSRQTLSSGAGSGPGVWDVQVKNAMRAGDGDAALRELRNFVLEHPKDLAARRRLAERFLAAGHRDLAIEHLRIAAELAPAEESLVLSLAQLLSAEGLKEEADRVMSQYRRDHEASPVFLSYAAIAKDEVGALQEGEALHREALRLDSRSVQLQNNLAFNLARQQKAAEAEAMYREILRRHPSFEAARNNLAELYATQLQRPEEALLHWKAASGPANAHNNLAAAYMQMGKNEEARRELEKALAIRFQFPEAQRNLRILAARTGGTVELKLKQDKEPHGLAKLAKAIRQAFVADEVNPAGGAIR